MRTLKKTLCLVLVLAMVLSCGIFASADFTDAEEVEYTEAVDVLTALDVIEGYPDGTFGPDKTLTRAEAAVILTRLLGTDDLKGSAPFTDMEGYDWAESAIAYCASVGIVNGVGDGKFAPGDELTGYAWAKMLAVALGADPDSLSGETWEIATAGAAKVYGLFTGNSSANGLEPCSREEACLYALNALRYSETSNTYTVDGVPFDNLYDALVFAALVGGEVEATPSTDNLLYDVHGVVYNDADSDVYGRPAATYTNAKKTINIEYVAEPVYTTTAALNEAGLQKALGQKAVITNVDFEETPSIGGNGTAVELYATGKTNEYYAVVIETKVAVLEESDIHAETKTTKAYVDLGEYVLETSEFKAGDVVLYTVGADDETVVTAVKAESITGVVTATGNGYFRVNGVKTELAANNAVDEEEYLAPTKDTQVVFYVDGNGYVVYACYPEEAPADTAPAQYIYVIKSEAKAGTPAGAGLIGTAADPAAAKAQVLDLTNGEVSVVDIAITTNQAGTAYVYAGADGKATAAEVTDVAPVAQGLYTYTELDSGYVFTPYTGKDITLKQNVAAVEGAGTATSKTVVNYVEYTVDAKTGAWSATVTTKTGIASFEKNGEDLENAIVIADKNGIISSITVVREKYEAPEVDVTFAVYAGAGEATVKGQAYAFYIDGVKNAEIYLAEDVSVAGIAKGDVVTIELTDGELSAIEAAVVLANGAVTYIDNTFVIVGGVAYYFAKDYTVVDADADYAVDTLAVKDNVTLYAVDGQIGFVVIDNAD